MTSATRNAIALLSLAAALVAVPTLRAQEVVELPERDQRMDADFEEVFRVGVITGEDWEMFGTIRSVAFDAQGNLYLFDAAGGIMDPELRVVVVDRAGRFLRMFGSSGQGPGEFYMPTSYAVLRDGTTIVGDQGHQAYHVFDPSGKFERMVRNASGATQSSGGGGNVSITTTTSISGLIHPDPRGGAVFTADVLGLMVGEGPTSPSTGRSRARRSVAKRRRRRPWCRPGARRANRRRTRSRFPATCRSSWARMGAARTCRTPSRGSAGLPPSSRPC